MSYINREVKLDPATVAEFKHVIVNKAAAIRMAVSNLLDEDIAATMSEEEKRSSLESIKRCAQHLLDESVYAESVTFKK